MGNRPFPPRPNFPSRLGDINAFDDTTKDPAHGLPGEFTDSATLLRRLRGSEIANGETALLAIEDVTSRAKSANSAKSITEHIRGLINFYIDARSESAATLAGRRVVGLTPRLHRISGRTWGNCREAARHSLTVWPDSPVADWPLTNPPAI